MSSPKNPADPNDLAVFHAAMANVKPLKNSGRRAPEAAPRKKPRRVAARAPAPEPVRIEDVTPIESGDLLEFARSGVQPNVLRRMRGGRVNIRATLDLHGLTGANAQAVLEQFITHCIRSGFRQVRIVHGKGRGIKGTPPVIKSIVNHWLREQRVVLAFCSAPPNDGGAGAVYVLLKANAQ